MKTKIVLLLLFAAALAFCAIAFGALCEAFPTMFVVSASAFCIGYVFSMLMRVMTIILDRITNDEGK